VQEVLPGQAHPEPARRQEAHVLPRLRLIHERRPLAVGLIAAAASGFVLRAASPPYDLGPLAFVALVPLLWAVGEGRTRRGALLGFTFGLAYYGSLLHWLIPFGIIAWLPVVVLQAAYAALFGLLAPLAGRSSRPLASAVSIAALWTAIDWTRGIWPVGGFTWGAVAYTQHGNHLLLPLATVTGMWGLDFVVVMVNGLVLGALQWMAGARLRSLALAGAAAVAVVLPGVLPVPAATGPSLDVAVVQGSVPLAFASDRLLQTEIVARTHIRLHRALGADPPDLAVWPENALPGDPAVDEGLGRAVAASIRSVGTPTLVGAIQRAAADRYFSERYYNQILLYSGSGVIEGRYSKLHLVPEGEYVPWPRLLAWTNRYRRGNAVLAPGSRIVLFDVRGTKVAAPICFENVFPNLFRRFVAEGAGIVVLATNDSSFLFSEASWEHVIASQVRAVETGRWVVQAAVSGESAVIDPAGVVRARTGLFQPAILRYRVPSSTTRTLYVRFGDWFPWSCGVVIAVVLAVSVVRRRRVRSTQTPPAGERSEAPKAPLPIGGGAAEPEVLVVLPTYNERATVAAVVGGVLAAGPNVHVLVVDDDSPDGTGELVAALAEHEPRVQLLRRNGKQGLASAYLTGFRRALEDGYDLVVEMDSDMSHLPAELPRLLDGAARYDLTIGSRYVEGGGVTNWSKLRLGLSKAGNAYARLALGLPVADATSGYRAYRRQLIESLVNERIHSQGYAFQIELAYRAWRQGFRVGEVPITFREREHGKSKLSRAIVIEALAKVTEWGIRDRVLKRGPSRSTKRPGPA
jgi:apolipoprotein N-acyltransferase